MQKILLLLTLVIVGACARAQKVSLTKISYELGGSAKLAVDSVKRVNRRIEFSLLGLSVADSVAINPKDIECGSGNTEYGKVSVKSVLEKDLIVFPKISYIDFNIKCVSRFDVDPKDPPYLLFKKIYHFKNNAVGEILDTNIKIKFE